MWFEFRSIKAVISVSQKFESRTVWFINFFCKRCEHPCVSIRDTRGMKTKPNRIPYFKTITIIYCIVFYNNYASDEIILFSFEAHNLSKGVVEKPEESTIIMLNTI
jgi:hypothetical protein